MTWLTWILLGVVVVLVLFIWFVAGEMEAGLGRAFGYPSRAGVLRRIIRAIFE